MPRPSRTSSSAKAPRYYWGTEVTLRLIRRYARQIAAQFDPERIVLFGSHAYGTPNQNSDVDLLVVMPTRNPVGQAVRIRLALQAPFPLDLLVRAPEKLAKAIQDGDGFLTHITTKGKVLYAKSHRTVGAQGRK